MPHTTREQLQGASNHVSAVQGPGRYGTEHPPCAAGVEKIVVVADMESYSDSAVPSMATRIECLRLAQVSHSNLEQQTASRCVVSSCFTKPCIKLRSVSRYCLGRNMHYVQAETLSTNGAEETVGFLGAVGSAQRCRAVCIFG